MFSFFENPWFLTITAILLVPIISLFRQPWGDKQNRKILLIPIALFLLAMGLDFLVETDREMIDSLITQSKTAAVTNDITLVDAIVSEDYSDDVHKSKKSLIASCRSIFATYGIEKIRNRSKQINITSPNATVTLQVVVHLMPRSTYNTAGTIVFVKMKLEFEKTTARKWLLKRADIISINNQPMNWNDIR
jgi:hypothetical protein